MLEPGLLQMIHTTHPCYILIQGSFNTKFIDELKMD